MVLIPYAECMLVESQLSKTLRGEKGFGSTGMDGLIQFDEEADGEDVCGRGPTACSSNEQPIDHMSLSIENQFDIDQEDLKWIESVFK